MKLCISYDDDFRYPTNKTATERGYYMKKVTKTKIYFEKKTISSSGEKDF